MFARVICVGKAKEKYYAMACEEYVKRLSRFGGVDVVVLQDEREEEHMSEALCRRVMQAEGARILRAIQPGEHVVAMAIGGRSYSSEAFAQRVDAVRQTSKLCFVIGGSLGLAPEVLARANESISLGAMTYPHQLARVILLEQLYRAAKICAGERYHK